MEPPAVLLLAQRVLAARMIRESVGKEKEKELGEKGNAGEKRKRVGEGVSEERGVSGDKRKKGGKAVE